MHSFTLTPYIKGAGFRDAEKFNMDEGYFCMVIYLRILGIRTYDVSLTCVQGIRSSDIYIYDKKGYCYHKTGGYFIFDKMYYMLKKSMNKIFKKGTKRSKISRIEKMHFEY